MAPAIWRNKMSGPASDVTTTVVRSFLVLDVDSDQLDDFDQTDKIYLEQLAQLMAKWF